jgi:hypothetical protein
MPAAAAAAASPTQFPSTQPSRPVYRRLGAVGRPLRATMTRTSGTVGRPLITRR